MRLMPDFDLHEGRITSIKPDRFRQIDNLHRSQLLVGSAIAKCCDQDGLRDTLQKRCVELTFTELSYLVVQ